MGTGLKVLLGAGIFFVILIIAVVSSVIGVGNTCVMYEQSIVAQYNQNRNNYDNFFKRVKEVAQVPERYSEDFKKVYDSILKGRYGEEGSKAAFQWIQENNPQFDSSIYKQVQQVIEAGRLDFEVNQKTLIDKKQIYLTYIGVFPNSFISKFLGYPKIDLSKFDIVTSDVTEKAFETKKADQLQVF